MKRELDIAIISDVHLGTYGCHAKELLNYLGSIKPKTLILNGDFIDIWQFKKNWFPTDHLKIIQSFDYNKNMTPIAIFGGLGIFGGVQSFLMG